MGEHGFSRLRACPGRQPVGRVAAEKFHGDVGTVGDRVVAGPAGGGKGYSIVAWVTGKGCRAKGLGGRIRRFVLIDKGPEIGIGKGARTIEADDHHILPLPLVELDQLIEGANFTGAQDGGQSATGRQPGEPGKLLGPVYRKGWRQWVGFCQSFGIRHQHGHDAVLHRQAGGNQHGLDFRLFHYRGQKRSKAGKPVLVVDVDANCLCHNPSVQITICRSGSAGPSSRVWATRSPMIPANWMPSLAPIQVNRSRRLSMPNWGRISLSSFTRRRAL